MISEDSLRNLTYRHPKGKPAWNTGTAKVASLVCGNCSKKVIIKAHLINKRKFCSKSCASTINMTDKKATHETRLKMRLAKLGKRLSPATEFQRNPYTPEKIYIRNSNAYSCWRKAIFERDNYTCQGCKVRGGRLQADHIKPFSIFPDLRLDVDNGRTLCEQCHKNTPTYAKNLFQLEKMFTGVIV